MHTFWTKKTAGKNQTTSLVKHYSTVTLSSGNTINIHDYKPDTNTKHTTSSHEQRKPMQANFALRERTKEQTTAKIRALNIHY